MMIIRWGVGLSKSSVGILLALTCFAGCSGGSQGGRDAGANTDSASQTGGRTATGGATGSGGGSGGGGPSETGGTSTGTGGAPAGTGGVAGAGGGYVLSTDGYGGGTGGGSPGGAGGVNGTGSGSTGGGGGMAGTGSGGTAGAGGGGTAGAGGRGGAGGTGGGAAGAGGSVSTCPAVTIGPLPVRAARSSGYAGTLTAYSALYNVTCTTSMNCADACVAAGGTRDSCTAGSECIDGLPAEPKHCLPPTYWRYEMEALAESADWTSAAEQTLVVIAYNDPLVLTDFGVVVPAGSEIRGIQFDVRRSADALEATDDSIRVLRNDAPVGADRKRTDTWTASLGYVTYGGPNDTWGTTWTAADVQSNKFGIAVAARYTNTAGNARAYIDFARVTVTYVPPTCN